MASRAPRSFRVCPGLDAEYHGFYLSGLAEKFGARAFHFSQRGFDGLPWGNLYLIDEASGRKVCIDARDTAELSPRALEWCDRYGKVSYQAASVPEAARAKVRALGPSFAIRLWEAPAALWHGLTTLARARMPELRARVHLAAWRRQYAYRVRLADYRPGVSRSDYVFFSASLWREAPESNRLRAGFVRAARGTPGIRFEGGFAPFLHGFEAPTTELTDLVVARRYSMAEWLERTRASLASFIAPGVHGCLTWRLAESLALGKAVIATPLQRELPAPLVHGVHAHFVEETEAAARDALVRLQRDAGYRRQLETNARRYFDAELAPRRAIERLVEG